MLRYPQSAWARASPTGIIISSSNSSSSSSSSTVVAVVVIVVFSCSIMFAARLKSPRYAPLPTECVGTCLPHWRLSSSNPYDYNNNNN